MKHILKCIITSIIFMSADNIYSQKFEMLKLDYIEIGKGDVDNKAPISFKRYQIEVQIPTKLKKEGAFISNGISYATTNINYRNTANFIPTDLDHFQTLEYKFMYTTPLRNNKWRFTGLIRPSLSTNSRLGENFEDIRFFGLAFVTKKVNAKLSYSLGAMYGTTLGIPAPLPFLMIHYTPNKNWKLDVGFPRVYITNNIGENTKIGANLIFQGENITLDDKLLYRNKLTSINNIKQSNIALGLFTKQKLWKFLYANANIGYTLSRSFDFRKDDTSMRNFDIGNNVYIKIGLSLGI